MMPQKSWPRISLDMGLNAKLLLLILFPGNLGQRDQAFLIFYSLFLFFIDIVVHCFFVFFFVFGQSFCSKLEGSLTPYLASMEYKHKAQETHRCPFSLGGSSQCTFFLSALQSLFMIAF